MNKFNTMMIFGAATIAICSGAQAQSVGSVLGAPATAAGSVLVGAGNAHQAIVPVVNSAAPQAVPATDGVTHSLYDLGTGVGGTGQSIQQSGGVAVGTSNGRPLVSAGATDPAQQGSVAAVLNR